MQKATLQELCTVLCDSLLGVMLVSFCHLNWSQYTDLISFLGHHWNETRQKWMRLKLPSGINVPQLLPSLVAVKHKWKEIARSAMTLSIIPMGVPAMQWVITDVLEYICGNEYLLSLCTTSIEVLEVIIKLDAFPVAGGNCFLMTLTLGNLMKIFYFL